MITEALPAEHSAIRDQRKGQSRQSREGKEWTLKGAAIEALFIYLFFKLHNHHLFPEADLFYFIPHSEQIQGTKERNTC